MATAKKKTAQKPKPKPLKKPAVLPVGESPSHKAERAAFVGGKDAGIAQERAEIGAWLRAQGYGVLAHAVEAGSR